jgi:hypothetical protein
LCLTQYYAAPCILPITRASQLLFSKGTKGKG